MLNFYDDDKIFDLMDEYGPLGVTIYDVILTIVYSQGYYAELSKDKLSRLVTRKIGNKWIKSQKVVVQVIDYCADLGLLSKDLLQQNIITSEGIQRRYHRIAVKLMKRQLYSAKYWLLEKEERGESLLNAPKNRTSSEEKGFNSEENRLNTAESPTKGKETKDIYNTAFQSVEVERAFQMYLLVREHNYGPIPEEQKSALIEELLNLSSDSKEQLAIVKKATAGGWKSFYKLKKEKPKEKAAPKKKVFDNFERRQYDMDSLERNLLKN
ncbi:MAG: DUF4373 domain-containing protein [Schaedlerella sp.]|nr:DUF4373 domain-containing protein [Schaedlerella sp.]